jgi:hypothetical protein
MAPRQEAAASLLPALKGRWRVAQGKREAGASCAALVERPADSLLSP